MTEATSLADQKLQLEIEEMKMSPWKKPSSLALWVPVLLGIFSLWSDWQDVLSLRQEAEELRNEAEYLEQRISRLDEQVREAASALETTNLDIQAFITLADAYTEQYTLIKTADGADRYLNLRAQLFKISGEISNVSSALRALESESGRQRSVK